MSTRLRRSILLACAVSMAAVTTPAQAAGPKASATKSSASQPAATQAGVAKTRVAKIRAPTPQQGSASRARATKVATLTELSPPEELPAEAIPKRSRYSLRYAGLRGGPTSEYVVWTSITTRSASGYQTATKVMPARVPTRQASAATRRPRARVSARQPSNRRGPATLGPFEIANGKPSEQVLTTAVVRKGPNTAAHLAMLEQLATSATALANNQGVQPHVVQSLFMYTAEEMELEKAQTQGFSWVSTRITTAELHALYSTTASRFGSVDYKAAVPHRVRGKILDVLINIPGVLPPRSRVDFTVKSLDLSTALQSATYEHQIKLRACIQGECAERLLTVGEYELAELKIRRRIIAGATELRLQAWVASRQRKGSILVNETRRSCGDNRSYRCRWTRKPNSSQKAWRELDLDVQTAGAAGWATYDTKPRQAPKPLTRVLNGRFGARVVFQARYIP